MKADLTTALLAARLSTPKQDLFREMLLRPVNEQSHVALTEAQQNLMDELSCPKARAAAAGDLASWEEQGIHLLSLGQESYPEILSRIHRPPIVLFYRGRNPGELVSETAVAIVGSRRADIQACDLTTAFSVRLVSAGACIVSGLALGIDAAAHKGAIEAGATFPTIAVMGCGLKQIYPRSNDKLARRIVEAGGTLLSHFEPDATPFPANFLDRNRVIAGLSCAVLVVQAPLRSGSLVTARYALEEGRDVMAVPGPINEERWVGSNKLIQQGAYLIACLEDVLTIVPVLKEKSAINSESPSDMSEGKLGILKLLKDKGKLAYDDLCACLNGASTLQTDLLELELEGAILRIPGNHICLAARGHQVKQPH